MIVVVQYVLMMLIIEVVFSGSVEFALWALAAVIYLPPTVIFLCSDKLMGIYKWLYALSVVPVLAILMVLNIWAVDHLFPGVVDWVRTNDHFRALEPRGIVVILTAGILPFSVCYAWYVLFVRLSRRGRK